MSKNKEAVKSLLRRVEVDPAAKGQRNMMLKLMDQEGCSPEDALRTETISRYNKENEPETAALSFYRFPP